MPDILEVDFAIRQLYARMVDAVWRQDCEQFANCYTPDGEWKIAGMHMKGREAIQEGATNLLTRCDAIHLIVGTPMLEVDGDTAVGRYNMTEFAKMPDGAAFMATGWYYDRYAKVDGEWLYQWRHWNMKYRGPIPMDGIWADTPDYDRFPNMPERDEPTFVRPPE